MAIESWVGPTLGRVKFGMALSGSSRSGGVSIGGVQSRSSLDGGGFWTGREVCSLRSDDAVRQWNGAASRAHDGATPFEVPCQMRYHQASGVTSASMAAPAALRAVDLSIAVVGGGQIQPGHRFTIDHPNWGARLYEVSTAVNTAGGNWDLKLANPLREAVAFADALDFNTHRLVCFIANASTMPVEEDGAVASPRGEVMWHEYLHRVI